jgi:hypothetical protein
MQGVAGATSMQELQQRLNMHLSMQVLQQHLSSLQVPLEGSSLKDSDLASTILSYAAMIAASCLTRHEAAIIEAYEIHVCEIHGDH